MGWNYLSIPRLQQPCCSILGMDKHFHHTLYWACDYSSMLGWKLFHVNKRGPWWEGEVEKFLYIALRYLRLWHTYSHADMWGMYMYDTYNLSAEFIKIFQDMRLLYSCWWHGSLCLQVISKHDLTMRDKQMFIFCKECVISVLRIDRKKNMFYVF